MRLVLSLARETIPNQSGKNQALPEALYRQSASLFKKCSSVVKHVISKLKPVLHLRSGFFVSIVLLSSFTPLQAIEREILILDIPTDKSLNIDWDHQLDYRLQFPKDLQGDWLLTIEQRGIDVIPTLLTSAGDYLISVNSAIDSVGIERLLIAADEMKNASVYLPLSKNITSPGSIIVSLKPIPNSHLQELLSKVMAGTAYLQNKDVAIPQSIHCEAMIEGFSKDPGMAARCFKTALELYKPEYQQTIGFEELSYYLADSVRRQGLLSDAQRLYLPLIRQDKDLKTKALSLHGLAWTVWQSGEHKIGEAFAAQATSVYEQWQQQDPQNRGVLYQQLSGRNIGCLILHNQQFLDRAEACYRNLEPDVLAGNDQVTRGLLIGNLGGIYYERGDIAKARKQFEESYNLYEETGNPKGKASVQNTLGLVETRAGDLLTALRHYQRAELIAAQSIPAAIDFYRYRMAQTYAHLGDNQRARIMFSELENSLALIGNKKLLTSVFNRQARIAEEEGNLALAEKYYLQQLDLEKQLDNKKGIVATLLRLAEVEIQKGHVVNAGTYLNEVKLKLPEIETFYVQNNANYINAKYLVEIANYDGAIKQLLSVLRSYKMAGYEREQILVNMTLVDAYWGSGQLDLAEAHAKAAIIQVANMRPENISIDLRASFSGHQRDAYEKLIDLYLHRWQQENNQEWSKKALIWSERARAQTLREAVSNIASELGLDQDLLEKRRNLSDQLNALATIRLSAIEKQQSEKLNQLNQQYQQVLTELETFDQQYLPHHSNASVDAELNLEDQLLALPKNTAHLSYYLGENTAVLWVLANGQLNTYQLPSTEILQAKVAVVRQALRRPGGYLGITAELEFLGNVLDPRLPDGIDRLQVSVDGVLNYLPFSALKLTNASNQYWLQRYSINYMPYMQNSAMPADSESIRWESLSIFADPEYDHRNISQPETSVLESVYPETLGLTRLRGSAYEAKVIATLGRTKLSDNMPNTVQNIKDRQTTIFSGLQATRSAVLEGEAADADILHFATHGIFNNQGSTLAGLALSVADAKGVEQPWLLTARDIYQTAINAQLVVMSACDLGDGRLAAGEGLLGMVRAFMYAGVNHVVSSQWKVSDRAVVGLMEKFYSALLQQGVSVSAALQGAQLSFLESESYSDPFYWAGFNNYQQQSNKGEMQYVSQ